MKGNLLRLFCALAAICAGRSTIAHAAIYDLGGTNQPAQNSVLTYDGTNVGIVNTYLGADTFYNAGIYGQQTISANIEAGAIWGGPSGHQDLTLSTYSYVDTADGALGDYDRHATWVGSVLGGLNYSALQAGNESYLDFGIAPATFLASGPIATSWTAPPQNPDGSYPSYSGSFNTSQAVVYSTFNRFMNTNATVNPTIAAQSPILSFPGLFSEFNGVANVINCSWGFTDTTGTDPLTILIDGFAREYPNTAIVVAAGNSSITPAPANSVTGPGSGYNVITVGATQTTNTVLDFTTVASFSAIGPQDYYDPVHGLVPGVRAAVDIVAPGTTIVAAYYGGQTGGNNPSLPGSTPDPGMETDLYSYPLAGTSFATPIVSGAVSLLNSTSIAIQGGYTYNSITVPSFSADSQNALVIKAVLMNSADKLPGWNNGQAFNAQLGYVVTTQALDWTQGAGQINFASAFNQYINPTGTHGTGGVGGLVAPIGWDLGMLTLGNYTDYVINTPLNAGDTMDATLTWYRDGTVDDVAEAGTDDGMANLFLEIWNDSFTTLYAESETIYDTSQELHFELPDDGDYGIRVLYASQMFGTPEAESYGLAWNDTPATAVPEPGTLALFVIALPGLAFVERPSARGSLTIAILGTLFADYIFNAVASLALILLARAISR